MVAIARVLLQWEDGDCWILLLMYMEHKCKAKGLRIVLTYVFVLWVQIHKPYPYLYIAS